MHTPGPWTADIGCFGDNETTGWINGLDGEPVVQYEGCGTHSADWPNPADKQLVLAAPDLLTALTVLYEETADYIRLNHLGDVYHNHSMQLARDAIAKAQGR